jgi:hypothetical protein
VRLTFEAQLADATVVGKRVIEQPPVLLDADPSKEMAYHWRNGREAKEIVALQSLFLASSSARAQRHRSG